MGKVSKDGVCCKKRVIDFNEFLSIKGCTTGKHNPIKMEDRNKQPDEEPEKSSSNKTENNTSSPKTTSKNEHSIPEMAERDHRKYGKETIITGAPLEHELEA